MAFEDPVVTVKQGQLRGSVDQNVYGGTFLAFRGIPYAKPPTGPLRFKDPLPSEPWTGVKDAKVFGSFCGQQDLFTRVIDGSDDCLYLNVYTPTTDVSSKRAVMVWIHGGAFICGSGDSTMYGPDYIVRKDVVLVTINYRLGVFGFLNLETDEAPGNQGLKDQVMALKWVQDNISNFGGDPNNVTIFGESAGAAAVHYLCMSPMSQGLFHKAIAQSGVATNPWAIVTKNAQKYATMLAANLGKDITDPHKLVEFLRTKDALELVVAQQKLLVQMDSFMLVGLFGPTVDSKSSTPFMPKHSLSQPGGRIKVPLLLGHNNNEGAFFLSSIMCADLKKIMGKLNANFKDALHPEMEEMVKLDDVSYDEIKRFYFGDKPLTMDNRHIYASYLSDMMFIRGILDVAKLQAEEKTPTYFYKFSFEPRLSLTKQRLGIGDIKGAVHAEELMFLFYPYMLKAMGPPLIKLGTKEYSVMEYLTQMWTDFAKTGNPTPMTTNLISSLWKPIESEESIKCMNIGEKLRMENVKLEDQTCYWNTIKNKL